MDAMAKFVSDHNVARFVDQLRSQDDPAKRTVLRRLLLEEVHKIGFNFEQLSLVDRQISEAKERVRAQKSIVERLRIKGLDTARAESLLGNLVGIQEMFEERRLLVLDFINENRCNPSGPATRPAKGRF